MGTEADANTPVQAAALTAPPVPLETESQPVPDDNVTRSRAPAETTQAVVPLLALETGQAPVVKVPPKGVRNEVPVQRSSTPRPAAPAAEQASAPALPIVQMPAAVVPETPLTQQPAPDHRGEATAAPAQGAPALAASSPVTPVIAEDKPSPDIPVTTADKLPPQPAPQTAPGKGADAAASVQPAPPPIASPPPAAVAMPDSAAPVRPAPAAAATAAPAHALPSPVAQLAPAMVALSARPDGSSTLTLRLQPPELGQVHIAIERPQDAPPRVDITVERSETLTLLLRDQPQLQRALDQAGVPSEGRSVAFHLATPEPSARPETPLFATPGGAPSYAGDDRRGPPREPVPSQPQPQPQDEAALDQADPLPPPVWLRAGLDITA